MMQWQKILSITAWAFLTFIAFATLSPYSVRPELTRTEPGLVVILEHVGAFFLLGLLFFLRYPERLRTVCLVVFGSAIALELAQALLPDRHARLVDALEKIFGGGAGIALGVAVLPVLARPGGLLAQIDKQRPGPAPHAADGENSELAIGSLAILLFASALVAFGHLRR